MCPAYESNWAPPEQKLDALNIWTNIPGRKQWFLLQIGMTFR
jgi:hypothetical protein